MALKHPNLFLVYAAELKRLDDGPQTLSLLTEPTTSLTLGNVLEHSDGVRRDKAVVSRLAKSLLLTDMDQGSLSVTPVCRTILSKSLRDLRRCALFDPQTITSASSSATEVIAKQHDFGIRKCPCL